MSVKLIIVEWILEVLRAVSIYFLNRQARIKAEIYSIENEELDMRTISPIIRGGIIHDEKVLAMRRGLCSSCEHFTESNRCSLCKCFMQTKTNFSWSSCPIGKWGIYKATDGLTTTS